MNRFDRLDSYVGWYYSSQWDNYIYVFSFYEDSKLIAYHGYSKKILHPKTDDGVNHVALKDLTDSSYKKVL